MTQRSYQDRPRPATSSHLQLRPGDLELSPEQLGCTPLLAGASDAVRRRLRSQLAQGGMVLRCYRAGDVIFRQGEPGWTAFYLLRPADAQRLGLPALSPGSDTGAADADGAADPDDGVTMAELIASDSDSLSPVAEIAIGPSGVHARSANSRFGRLLDRVYRRRRVYTLEADAPASLDDDGSIVGHLRPGELLGEMSCFTHAPRSASVRAVADCYAVEMLSSVLEAALANDEFRRALDSLYRKHVLRYHVAEIPILEEAPPEALARLRDEAELLSFEPGQTLYEEGAPADALYFVRMGTVRLSQGGAEGRVLSYASRGETLAVSEVVDGAPYAAQAVAFIPGRDAGERLRRATRGLRTEVIRISRASLEGVFRTWPELGTSARWATLGLGDDEPDPGRAVENLAAACGLLQGEKLMLIDLETCTRCGDCVRACAAAHDGIPRLSRSGPRFGNHLVPTTCRQCMDPTCLIGCPVSSIHRGPSHEIVIEDWCIGCGLCAEQCPYEAIQIRRTGGEKKAFTCDQCAAIGDGTPLCVYACGAGAARRVHGRDVFGVAASRP